MEEGSLPQAAKHKTREPNTSYNKEKQGKTTKPQNKEKSCFMFGMLISSVEVPTLNGHISQVS